MGETVHGEWLPYEYTTKNTDGDEKETVWYECSVCGSDALGRCYDDEWYSYPYRTQYCPHCGAKMDGGIKP